MLSAMLRAMLHMMLPLIYLPWSIETIQTVSHRPRWPRQVQSSVAVTDRFANECCQCKPSIIGGGLTSCQTVGSLL
jgi:hypothetical protein